MSESPAGVPQEAIQTLQRFVDAGMRRDEPAMRACLTRKTLESGQFNGQSPEGVRFVMGEARAEKGRVVIPLKAFPVDGPADGPPAMEMQCLMVQEEGEWKFDLAGTMDLMMGGALETAVGQMADTMGKVMEGVGDALSEGFKQAFGESGEEKPAVMESWEGAALEATEEELLPLAEMTDLPKTTAAVTEAVGSPVVVQAAIADLLKQLGSDDRTTLINWFDDTLFASWGEFFKWVGSNMPVKDRLRAVRIEAASFADNRFLALDGSDLVYRMWLNANQGYYSDAEFLDVLPGLLAGLPEKIDTVAVGHRLIPDDEESRDFELYKKVVVPRHMRRISKLLGHHVNLEANWEDVSDSAAGAKQFSRWGLNRIYGAVALACTEAEQREALRANMKTIRIVVGYNVVNRSAEYKDGVFEVGLFYYGGEIGCFYENELVKVLGGEVIRYQEPEEAPEEEKPQKGKGHRRRNDGAEGEAVLKIWIERGRCYDMGMKRRKRKPGPAGDEGAYTCPTCGEQIVIPLDSSGGSEQEYVEDCPVCCNPNVIHIEFFEEGEPPRVWAEAE